MSSSASRLFLVLLFTLLLHNLITLASCETNDTRTQSEPQQDARLESTSRSLASGADSEARQYFKIHVAPKKSLKQSAQAMRRAIAANQDQQQQQPNKQKISNARLKKLLNQSLLLKASNSSASDAQQPAGAIGTKPSFKFVFIQRATAAPSSKASSPSAANSSGGDTSLAASVSKQLASSLLNSAANIVDNLHQSAKPSISSLAAALSQQTTEKQAQPSEHNLSSSTEPSLSDDIKRAHTKSTTSYSSKKGASTTSSTKTRPARIYNLPVKFVSNGQPTGVVINTIKQHLATIRKFHAVANKAALGVGMGAINHSQVTSSKRRKQQHELANKLKGNSRLIYLPLKYLSNARPNKIIISKATHKSTIVFTPRVDSFIVNKHVVVATIKT